MDSSRGEWRREPKRQAPIYAVEETEEFARGCRTTPAVSGELALGYAQITGFRGTAFELNGSIEELPSLTFYTGPDRIRRK